MQITNIDHLLNQGAVLLNQDSITNEVDLTYVEFADFHIGIPIIKRRKLDIIFQYLANRGALDKDRICQQFQASVRDANVPNATGTGSSVSCTEQGSNCRSRNTEGLHRLFHEFSIPGRKSLFFWMWCFSHINSVSRQRGHGTTSKCTCASIDSNHSMTTLLLIFMCVIQ